MSDAVLQAEVREWRSLHTLAVQELALTRDVNRVLRMENKALRERIARLEDRK